MTETTKTRCRSRMAVHAALLVIILVCAMVGASAGATIVADGPGNVDMVTWVTMTDNGPEIAGIALKGIFDRKGLDPAMFEAYDRTPVPGGMGH